MTVSIIHSGRLPLSRNASATLRRLTIFFRFASLVAERISWRSVSLSVWTSTYLSISRTASPPMPAENLSSPYSSTSCM